MYVCSISRWLSCPSRADHRARVGSCWISRYLYDLYGQREIARKAMGVGNVETRAWVLLLVRRDNHDPPVLQSKQVRRILPRATDTAA